jgi:SNF2 family DNA or RNA helicase
MYKLMKHQEQAVNICKNKKAYALFFGCGSGKSLTAITIMRDKYIKHKSVLQTLIVCPLSVAKQWKAEIAKFYPDLEKYVSVAVGSYEEKKEAINNSKGILVTNIDSLSNANVVELLKAKTWACLIADESHMLKNFSSKRTKNAIKLADKITYKLILSGTPSTNGLMDIWSQFRILDKHGEILPESFFVFRNMYFRDANLVKKSRMGSKYFPDWQPSPDSLVRLKNRIADHCSIVKTEDVVDLPEHVKIIKTVEMTEEQRRVYSSMKNQMIAEFNNSVCVAQLALVKLIRLQQLVAGIFVDTENNFLKHIPCNRLTVLEETLEEISSEAKVIIWSKFEITYEQIGKVCEKLGRKYVTLTGDDNSTQKQESIEAFTKSKDVNTLIANQASGGTGLNLTEASYSIYYTKDFNLAYDEQSEARNYRKGSEMHSKVIRIDLVTENSVDEKINEALQNKRNIASELLSSKGVARWLEND